MNIYIWTLNIQYTLEDIKFSVLQNPDNDGFLFTVQNHFDIYSPSGIPIVLIGFTLYFQFLLSSAVKNNDLNSHLWGINFCFDFHILASKILLARILNEKTLTTFVCGINHLSFRLKVNRSNMNAKLLEKTHFMRDDDSSLCRFVCNLGHKENIKKNCVLIFRLFQERIDGKFWTGSLPYIVWHLCFICMSNRRRTMQNDNL